MISSGLGHEALVSHSPVSGPLLPDPDPPGFSFGKYLILLPGCGVDIFVFEFETEELESFETLTFCSKACGTDIFGVFFDDLKEIIREFFGSAPPY
jgi:hypothetical protein